MKALFLLKVETGKLEEVQENLKGFKVVQEALATFGGWDIVVIGDFESQQKINKFMREEVVTLEGVKESNTLIEARK